ncbi:MAG: hypothetical protein HQL23_06515 [Candidatus Omnitrophica bacterium]|nr:hypothetical protein [Candidatus Omnitrophota bacterium]
MLEYQNYDKAVIVTRDEDFHCLMEYFKKRGKLGKIIIPNKEKYSFLLRKFKSDMAWMNDLCGKLELK